MTITKQVLFRHFYMSEVSRDSKYFELLMRWRSCWPKAIETVGMVCVIDAQATNKYTDKFIFQSDIIENFLSALSIFDIN